MDSGVGQSLGAELISLSTHAPFAPVLHIPRLLLLRESYYLELALVVVGWLVG